MNVGYDVAVAVVCCVFGDVDIVGKEKLEFFTPGVWSSKRRFWAVYICKVHVSVVAPDSWDCTAQVF